MNLNEIANIFKECELIGEKIVVKKANLVRTISSVKDDYHCSMLKDITAVDNQENGIELIYRLFSPENGEDVIISTYVKDNEIGSVSGIFDSATADEKEIYDLFGINFVGNKELERLYMPEGWKGHPLRKDYEGNDERLNWNE